MNGKTTLKYEEKRDFLKHYLTVINADYYEENNVFTISLPEKYLEDFEQKTIKLCFKSIHSNTTDKSFYPVNKFFEHIFQICSKQGEIASFIIPEKDDLPSILDEIKFINVEGEYGGSYSYLKFGIIFYFQASVSQPDYWRKLFHIALDLSSLNSIDWVPTDLISRPLQSIKIRKRVLTSKKMRNVYTKACEVLTKQLEDDLSEFKQQNHKHLQKALTRISSYYQRVKIEEETRIKSLEAQVAKIDENIKRHRNLGTYPKYLEKKRRLSNKVEEEKNKLLQYFNKIATFENKEKKREEERHEIICNCDLIAISLIHYKVIRELYRLYNDKSSTTFNIYKIPAAAKIETPLCQSCNKSTSAIGLCSQSHVVCHECITTCSKCKNPKRNNSRIKKQLL